MITERKYLMGIRMHNTFLFFISIGIIVGLIILIIDIIFMFFTPDSPYIDDVESIIPVALNILKILYLISGIFQIIAAFKKTEKKETLAYKIFSILSFIVLPIISPIIIFFLLRSDLKKLDEK
jgi:formate hydrogenlyase subunit 3/multisubunit Na+/H+ antiporter MnhD subunit